MFAYELPFEPPIDNCERIENIMNEAFALFLKKGYNKSRFQEIYDLVAEEIENNLNKYLPEDEYDFGY